MAQPGERQVSTIIPTIADILTARRRAATATADFEGASMEHQRFMDACARTGDMAVRFSIRPSLGADNLTALLMRVDDIEESEGIAIRTRQVTRSKPFEAERYKQRRHYFQHLSVDGWYDFEREESRSRIEELDTVETKTWLLQLTMDKLSEVDITETRDGLVVAQWLAGQAVPVVAGQPQLEIAQAESAQLAQ